MLPWNASHSRKSPKVASVVAHLECGAFPERALLEL
jgi:hypothetical protein